MAVVNRISFGFLPWHSNEKEVFKLHCFAYEANITNSTTSSVELIQIHPETALTDAANERTRHMYSSTACTTA